MPSFAFSELQPATLRIKAVSEPKKAEKSASNAGISKKGVSSFSEHFRYHLQTISGTIGGTITGTIGGTIWSIVGSIIIIFLKAFDF